MNAQEKLKVIRGKIEKGQQLLEDAWMLLEEVIVGSDPVLPEDPPVDTPPPDEEDPVTDIPATTVPPGDVEIAFVFNDGKHFDVLVNGGLLPKEKPFDYTFTNDDGGQAGVKIVKTTTLKTVELDPDQIKVAGLGNDGFGEFKYGVINKDPKYDFYKINSMGDLVKSGASNPLAVTVSREGDTVYGDKHPDPLFYKGWREDPLNHPNNREFHPQWSTNKKIVFSFLHYGKGAAKPVDEIPKPSTQPEQPVDNPEPKQGQTQIALNFLDGVNLDVTVNGILYPATDDFDYRWDNNGVLAGTKVVTVDGDFLALELNPDQIRKEGLNNDGWGAFCYKVVNKDAVANLYAINSRHDNSNQEFWGTDASVNPLGVIVSRMGTTLDWGKDASGKPIKFPDPLFYKGFRDDPKNYPDRRTFHSQWSKTGKMAISFFKYNENAENPVV